MSQSHGKGSRARRKRLHMQPLSSSRGLRNVSADRVAADSAGLAHGGHAAGRRRSLHIAAARRARCSGRRSPGGGRRRCAAGYRDRRRMPQPRLHIDLATASAEAEPGERACGRECSMTSLCAAQTDANATGYAFQGLHRPHHGSEAAQFVGGDLFRHPRFQMMHDGRGIDRSGLDRWIRDRAGSGRERSRATDLRCLLWCACRGAWRQTRCHRASVAVPLCCGDSG